MRQLLIFGLAITLTLAHIAPARAQSPEFAVDIKRRPLATSLRDLAHQTGIDLIYDRALLGGRRSPVLKGKLRIEAALTRILDGTNLFARRAPSGAWIIEQRPALTDPPPQDPALTEDITVTGYRFLSKDTSGTTNLPIPIEKVPQSISLVSSGFIKAANLKSLADIAEYTAGATNAGDPGGNGTVVRLRGFSAGRSVDGLPINISNGTNFEPENAIYERLEVVKGPTSVVYGVSSPGGLVNYVTKSGTAQTTGYLLAQAGRWNNFRVEGQVSGPLDSAGRIRAIGLGVRDQGDSFIDFRKHASTTVYAGIDADVGDLVTAYLHGGYQKFKRSPFDGMPGFANGSFAPVPRSFFIGSPNILTTTSVYYGVGNLTWNASSLLKFSLKGNFDSGKIRGASAYGYGLQPNGNIKLSGFNYRLPGTGNTFDNYAIDLSSIYHLDALGLKNSFVSFAALYEDNRGSIAGASPSPIFTSNNIFNGVTAIGSALDNLINSAAGQPLFKSNRHNVNYTLSVQSIIKMADPLMILLGTSYSNPHSTASDGSVKSFNFASQISYRAGIVYDVLSGVNVYVSLSQSFSPQLIYSIDANGVTRPLPQLEGEQYEGGLKYRSANGRLLMTGSLFQIRQKNQGQFDRFVAPNNYFKPIGETTHKGLELEVVGQITPKLQVNAGLAYLDAKVSKDSDTLLVGQKVTYLPKQTWSLFSTYTLSGPIFEGLSIGGGVRHVSSVHTAYLDLAGVRPTIDIPRYTLADATVSYEADKWLVQLNVQNVFDKHYLINNYQSLQFGNAVGTPADVTLTLRRNF